MSDPKYVVITAANCVATNRSAALDNMGGFAQDLHNGTDVMAIRYGIVQSGLNPGALVFVQMYESLSGLEQAMEVISNSASYASLLKDQNVQPYVRNIAKFAPGPFDNASALPEKYLVFTRAKAVTSTAQEMTEKVAASTSGFAANGAQTLSFGQIITGNDIGQHLLGVSYQSMSAIEATYDALAQDTNFRQLTAGVEVNMRSIIQLYT